MIIDCDANATYSPDQRIRGVISSYLESLGNPSSLHRGGQRARAAIEEARAAVGRLVNAKAHDRIIFTSGATEANNTIIQSFRGSRGELVSASNEHPCVLEPLRQLASLGSKVIFVDPTSDGSLSAEAVSKELTQTTAFVSIMAANNEVGAINPIGEIARVARQRSPRAVIHSDAAQLLGKGTVSLDALGVDLLTISAHKIGGLSGVGAIVMRDKIDVKPLLIGGPQEGKVRGGTENVLGIAVFGVVADALVNELPSRIQGMERVRDDFERMVLQEIPNVIINASGVARLPNTSSLYIPGVRADDLVVALDLEGILVSSGAACSSGKPEPSHVLISMGQSEERVRSTIRVSFRSDLSRQDVPRVVTALQRASERMRNKQSGASSVI